VANTGEQARLLSFVNEYDGIVLDVQLGDRHGFEIVQEIRAAGKSTPVLLYTGLDGTDAIVRGLDAGADEYVVKPISNQELRARVRSLLRRRVPGTLTPHLMIGSLCLNRLTRRATQCGATLDLTPMEIRLLEHLMVKAGEVVTRSELHDKVWDMHFDPSSNLVDAHMARLRKKLQTPNSSVEVVTRRGIGFVLQAVTGRGAGAGHDAYGVSSAQS